MSLRPAPPIPSQTPTEEALLHITRNPRVWLSYVKAIEQHADEVKKASEQRTWLGELEAAKKDAVIKVLEKNIQEDKEEHRKIIRELHEEHRKTLMAFKAKPAAQLALQSCLSEKLPDPAPFKGEGRDLFRFKSQIEWNMRINKDRYSTPEKRLAYVYSRLEGSALTYVAQYLSNSEGIFHDYKDILHSLDQAFADPDRAHNARRELHALRQKNRKFSVYFAEFQRLAAEAEYPESALLILLEQGISIELRELLRYQSAPENDYHLFVEHLRILDNRYRAQLAANH